MLQGMTRDVRCLVGTCCWSGAPGDLRSRLGQGSNMCQTLQVGVLFADHAEMGKRILSFASQFHKTR